MARRKAELVIGERAFLELKRLFKTREEAYQRIGCTRKTIYAWKAGEAPSAIYLARLCELGADVIWILTGHHGQHPGQKSC